MEAHSWKDYRTRVLAARDAVRELVDLAAERDGAWRAAAARADAASARLPGTEVPLAYAHTAASTPRRFFARTPSAVSGRLAITYDRARPESFEVPFFGEVKPSLTVRAPRAGYVVPAAHAGWMAEKLALHGIAFQTLKAARPATTVETCRATEAKLAAASRSRGGPGSR